MIICKKCNAELQDGSIFCNKCGANLSEKKNHLFKPNLKLIIPSIGGLILIGLILFLLIGNNPISQFQKAIQVNNYVEANEIYENEIQGNLQKEKDLEVILKEDLEDIKKRFIAGENDYSSTTTKLETIQKTELLKSEVSALLSYINKLNNSRTAFQTGEELLKNNNIKDALVEYKKVVEEDENYSRAQDLIKDKSNEYKITVLTESEQKASELNYTEAIDLLNDALKIIPGDSDLEAKRTVFEKQNEEKLIAERREKMEETRTQQEVEVQSAGIVIQSTEYKSLYPDMIQVIVHNNTDKTVKSMLVSMLGFDTNGLPVKIERRFGNSSFEFIGMADNVNIISNATFGKDNGWEVDKSHGIKTVLACVKEVEYYDGTKWENPYYEYWVEEYKEKPLTN
ncbi:DUF5780 domain-containing protein [Bacillus horti]|uniref:Tetratricopeptide (TPR) repeat protein n=1 Tax=Caldalkalibacillus horti TaxID=77523 RepID=A0ABT9W4Z3_9BACI|nr:DUF5780 domain-containing protein [Bacillus horti]MDQ0168200.1 tetratricopeptide (TPR) repeat protein [Bacillus horti]